MIAFYQMETQLFLIAGKHFYKVLLILFSLLLFQKNLHFTTSQDNFKHAESLPMFSNVQSPILKEPPC